MDERRLDRRIGPSWSVPAAGGMVVVLLAVIGDSPLLLEFGWLGFECLFFLVVQGRFDN